MSFGSALVAAIQTGCGLEEVEAAALAQKIIAGGAENGHAGVVHYWPLRMACSDTEERDAAIRDEFNGKNLAEVCRIFDVSAATVYRALKRP